MKYTAFFSGLVFSAAMIGGLTVDYSGQLSLGPSISLAQTGAPRQAPTPRASDRDNLRDRERDGPIKPKTKRVQAMNKPAYEALTAAQAAIEIKDYLEADRVLREALAIRRINEYEQASVWQTYAYLYAEQENYLGAIDAFRRSIDVSDPEQGKGLPYAQVVQTMYNLGQLYMVIERFQDAVNMLERWRQVAESVTSPSLALIATAYFQLENYDRAIPLIIEAIDISPNPREQWYQLLLAMYFEKEDYPRAGELLEVMVGLFPTVKTYWMQLAAIYGELEREKESFSVFVMAHKQGFFLEDREFVRLARLYMFHDNPIKGADVMKECFDKKICPRNSENLEVLANAQFNSREYEGAIGPLKEAALKSKKGKLSLRLGQAYLQSEEWKESEIAFEQALKKTGLTAVEKGELWMLLGIAELEQKKYQQAIGSMQQATTFKKTKDDATKWIRFIQQQVAAENAAS